MNKKILVISILSILIILAIGISVYAGIINISTTSDDDYYKTRADADKTKILKLFTTESILSNSKKDSQKSFVQIAKSGSKLKYKNTLNYNDTLLHDIYVDENNNEYYYDSLDNLNGFTANREAVHTASANIKNTFIDKTQAVELAKKYAHMLFGETANSFVLKSAKYNQSDNTYNVMFVKKIGKHGIINSVWCACNILPNGEMSFCSLSRAHDFDEFDESLLDNITDTVLKDFVSGQIADGVSFEITAASLVKDADTYRIDVDVTETHGEEIYANTYRYALS